MTVRGGKDQEKLAVSNAYTFPYSLLPFLDIGPDSRDFSYRQTITSRNRLLAFDIV